MKEKHFLWRVIYILLISMLCSSYVYSSQPDKTFKRQKKVFKGYEMLKSKAKSKGTIRILAKLKAPNKKSAQSKAMKPNAFADNIQSLNNKGLKSKRNFKNLNIAVYEVDSDKLDALLDNDLIEFIQEDTPDKLHLGTSVPFIGGVATQARGATGNGQTVVIIDSGVDSFHPYLAGRVVEEACFSTTWSDWDIFSLCPTGSNVEIGPGAGVNCNVPGSELQCSHGTHVAGIAAGSGINDGMAPDANIIAIQVFTEWTNFNTSCDGNERCILSLQSDQLAALEWIINNASSQNIAAVNMSLGGGFYTTACDNDIRSGAISKLRSLGIPVVISSGNSGFSNGIGAPACISDAITVGATGNSNNIISNFSNSATLVDVVAPGTNIQSSIAGGGFDTWSGTSMAAPHVTGAIAQIRSILPFSSVGGIEFAIEQTGVATIDTKNGLSFPRLDINQTLLFMEQDPDDNRPLPLVPVIAH